MKMEIFQKKKRRTMEKMNWGYVGDQRYVWAVVWDSMKWNEPHHKLKLKLLNWVEFLHFVLHILLNYCGSFMCVLSWISGLFSTWQGSCDDSIYMYHCICWSWSARSPENITMQNNASEQIWRIYIVRVLKSHS